MLSLEPRAFLTVRFFGGSLGDLQAQFWSSFWVPLGVPWGVLGAPWELLGDPWGHFWSPSRYRGLPWAPSGSLLVPFRGPKMLGGSFGVSVQHLGALSGTTWVHVGGILRSYLDRFLC